MARDGPGPHSTPLIAGDRVYTIGTNAVLHCFDKKTGRVIWKHDLPAEFGAPVLWFGYGCSPLAYEKSVILPVDRTRDDDEQRTGGIDGAGQALMAFEQETGKVVWKSQDCEVCYSSPILVKFAGHDQLVLQARDGIVAVNPRDGTPVWHVDVRPAHHDAVPTPLWIGDGRIFCCTKHGSQLIKLTARGDRVVAEELWSTTKLRSHHSNAIFTGGCLYGTSGVTGDHLFVCMAAGTGKRLWVERGHVKSMMLYADGKLIILDENGQLALATASPKGMTIHARCKITARPSWTAQTLVGTTLYVRDRKHIMALDLG